MDSPESQIYRFADIEVDALRCYLKCGGEERHLRHKTFQVLVYLLEQRGRVVSKDELIHEVWKDTAVVDDVLVQSVKDIRRALGDDSHHSRFIKTIPKSGYRFIGTFEEEEEKGRKREGEKRNSETRRRGGAENKLGTWNLELGTEKDQRPKTKDRRPISLFKNRAVLMVISVSIIALSLFVFLGQTFRQQTSEITLTNTPGKKPLVVMFFENQSGNEELDWLREGLADMLITNLSRSDRLTVLSRGQLRVLLERTKRDSAEKIGFDEALEIARRTGAEAVITGSFARLGEKVRLEVQLHDVKTGGLNAAESLTVDRAEQILTEIDLLSLKLANRLGASENKSADLTQVMTNNLEAYRYYSLAVEKAQALHNQEAIEMLERAVALDPDFAMAHARIGYAYALSWGLAEKGKPHLERAFRLSERLTEKDRLSIAAWYATANLDYPNAIQAFREIIVRFPLEIESYWRLARLQAGEERLDEAVETLKQGLLIDPEAKDIYNALGGTFSLLGRHDEARTAHERYVALAPAEPNAYDSLGLTYQWAGNFPAAIENYNRALELNPNFEIAVIHLANTRFQLGQYRAAIDLYRRYIAAAKSDGERGRGFDSLAYIYLKKRNFAEAEKALNEVRKFRKAPIWNQFLITLERGDPVTAAELEEFFSAKSLDTDRGARAKQRFDFHLRGIVALKNNQTDEAIANFKEVVRRPPPTWNIDAYEDCLANAYLELGRFDEAAAEYERVLRLNPHYPLAQFHLAQTFERKGEFEKARAYYQNFLELWNEADEELSEILEARRFLNGL
ncbi:MAG: tetratricopeptide repeat protein [Pyrinomonadaceae bacterium]|nr:tetratricopeptide repeat protein [Pyrinomonadaceae bacterium]